MQEKSNRYKGYDIRYLTPEDLDQYNALLRYTFQVTEQDLARTGWRDDEIKQSKFPVLQRADVLGCFDGENLISQFAVYPLEMNVYGRICPIGFVTSVCTYPEYSGQGIIKRLMRQCLSHMRERKQTLALLYPYSIPLYRKFGWEIISNKISYIVKDRQIPCRSGMPGRVRRVDWENSDFMELHAEFARATHGCILRSALAWEEYWRWDEDDTIVAVYYGALDAPQGYIVYLIKHDVMYIKEMTYLTREAQEGLWSYIHAHDSMIDEVHGNLYFNEPIAFEMTDGDIEETIRPYIMGRIVDVEQFFSVYSCDPAKADLELSFKITDGFLEWNNKTLTVRFHNGKCEVVDRPSERLLEMSIATLSTLALGYKTAAQLHRMGRIIGRKEDALQLDGVLFHELPYISDYI